MALLLGAVMLAGLTLVYVAYRRLLPAELPTKASIVLSRPARHAVTLGTGPAVRAHFSRIHLSDLTERGLLPRERELKRHARESALSAWLWVHWTPAEVVDGYAERVRVGRERRGLSSAAEDLFGKPLDALARDELALIVVLPQSPIRVDLACHPDRARDARNLVLERMAAAGLVDAAELSGMQARSITVLTNCGRGIRTPTN